MDTIETDVIVIGGGAMGTATGWALANRGVKVVVLEQFAHVHAMGSHGGKTRIFRHAYAEGERYVQWTLDADQLWSGLQERTGTAFMYRVGCLDISAPGYHRAREAYASAQVHGLSSEWIDGAEVNRRWPGWTLPSDREVCFGPDAGFLDVATSMTAMAHELRQQGGLLIDGSPVLSWTFDGSSVSVVTASTTYEADRLVLTVGAWSIDLLRDLGIPLEVRRKPVIWFEVSDPSLIEPERFPAFISDDELGEFYGIPSYQEPGVKVGMHTSGDVVHPDSVDRTLNPADVENDVLPFMKRNIRGVTGNVLASAVCMYTMTPDQDFVIDRHPAYQNVVFATGFSGHGFKFAPVIGEYLATLATDARALVRPDFGVDRFSRP